MSLAQAYVFPIENQAALYTEGSYGLVPVDATLSPIAGACPTLHLAAHWHSNPIAHRVRRKRQRLPPSLLIENASDQLSFHLRSVLPEAFPIKASDDSGTTSLLDRRAFPVTNPAVPSDRTLSVN
jgi:hypothetical protein